MKRQIRKSVFETNSSSVHAIIITKNRDFKLPSKVTFKFGEFGWEQDTLDSIYSKASYFITALANLFPNEFEKNKNKLFCMFAEDNIDCEFAEKSEDEYYPHGYIDHVDELRDWVNKMMRNKKHLYRYLFSYESFVRTWNDNIDDDFEKFLNPKVPYKYDYYYKSC